MLFPTGWPGPIAAGNNYIGQVGVSNWPASWNVSVTNTITGTTSVSNFPSSFLVSNFPTYFPTGTLNQTQAVSGAVSLSGTPSVTLSGSSIVTVDNFPLYWNVRLEDGTGSALSSSSGNLDTNLSFINGFSPYTAGHNGTLGVGGIVAAGSNISAANFPLIISGSDYGGTPDLWIPKVDSSGNQYIGNFPSSFSITGTASSYITNWSGLSFPGSFSVSNFPAYFPTGTLSQVQAVSGSVSIGNTPSVTLSGTGSVNIANWAGLNFPGSFSVSNFPNYYPSGTLQQTQAVSGTVSIGNTPSVTLSGTGNVNITNWGGLSFPGSFSVSNFPSYFPTGTLQQTQAVSGTVSIGNTPSVTLSGTGSVNIANWSGFPPLSVSLAGSSISFPSSFSVSNFPATQGVSGSVAITTNSALQVNQTDGFGTVNTLTGTGSAIGQGAELIAGSYQTITWAATGTSTVGPWNVANYSTIAIQATGTVITIAPQGSLDGVNWVGLEFQEQGSSSFSLNITNATQIWTCPVNFVWFRLSLSGANQGLVTFFSLPKQTAYQQVEVASFTPAITASINTLTELTFLNSAARTTTTLSSSTSYSSSSTLYLWVSITAAGNASGGLQVQLMAEGPSLNFYALNNLPNALNAVGDYLYIFSRGANIGGLNPAVVQGVYNCGFPSNTGIYKVNVTAKDSSSYTYSIYGAGGMP